MRHRYLTNTSLEEKFWAGISKKGPADCWNWTKSLTVHGGYGQFTHMHKLYKAHQVSYRIHFGEIPKGKFVCHKCNNPACCNPAHLYAGTPADNWRDTIESKKACRFPIYRGEECHDAKLTEAKVRDILTSNKGGAELAKEYGVSRSAISAIRRRRTWKHVNA